MRHSFYYRESFGTKKRVLSLIYLSIRFNEAFRFFNLNCDPLLFIFGYTASSYVLLSQCDKCTGYSHRPEERKELAQFMRNRAITRNIFWESSPANSSVQTCV